MSKRKHRNLIISDDISHMGITDKEYRVIEDNLDPSLNKEDETSINFPKSTPTSRMTILSDGVNWVVFMYMA